MVKIRIMSDVHNEFGLLDLPFMDDEENTVLVLAGDIGVAVKPDTYLDFLTDLNTRFKRIVYIMGNHEHYRGKFTLTLSKIADACAHLKRVSVVNNEVVIVDDVAFVCTTLWTDFDKGNQMSMWYAKNGMNDFKIIRIGPKGEPWRRKFAPTDAFLEFGIAKQFIFESTTSQQKLGNKVVVVTHHAPSHESSAPEWRNTDTAGAYASDLQSEIIEAKPNLFIHGHMHTSSDYFIGQTRVICNPRGYIGHSLNPTFDPRLCIEV